LPIDARALEKWRADLDFKANMHIINSSFTLQTIRKTMMVAALFDF